MGLKLSRPKLERDDAENIFRADLSPLGSLAAIIAKQLPRRQSIYESSVCGQHGAVEKVLDLQAELILHPLVRRQRETLFVLAPRDFLGK